MRLLVRVVRLAGVSKRRLREFALFCVVGIALAALYFILAYAGSSGLGIHPVIASGCAYVLMIPAAYFAHRVITFRSSTLHQTAFPRFLVNSCMGVVLSWVIPYLALKIFGAPDWAAFLAVGIVVPAVSFVTTRYWVFQTP